MTDRLDFLRMIATAPIAAGPTVAGVQPLSPNEPYRRLNAALVLSGGSSRGAYEAGVIGALVHKSGVADGKPLPGFDAVVGTSIGSLNAYLVSTGQYSRLARTWHSVAEQNLFEIKGKYRSVVDPSSGLFNRIFEGLSLERGLVTNERGILDQQRIARFIDALVGDTIVPLVPLVFTVTNLSTQRAELFYCTPAPVNPATLDLAVEALHNVIGATTTIRRLTDAKMMSRALLASTAIPILFDPVEMAFDGDVSQYTDGGVVDNTPVDIARTLADNIYAILVDPVVVKKTIYPNALTIAFTSFAIAQRRIINSSLHSAVIESEGKRLFVSRNDAHGADFWRDVTASDIYVIRPAEELAVATPEFSSQRFIDNAYERGYADGTAGWQRYER